MYANISEDERIYSRKNLIILARGEEIVKNRDRKEGCIDILKYSSTLISPRNRTTVSARLKKRKNRGAELHNSAILTALFPENIGISREIYRFHVSMRL